MRFFINSKAISICTTSRQQTRAGDAPSRRYFLLPKNTPHSPRRAVGSWTYVVERQRGKEEIDRFIWPCENAAIIFMRLKFVSTIRATQSAAHKLAQVKSRVGHMQAVREVLDL